MENVILRRSAVVMRLCSLSWLAIVAGIAAIPMGCVALPDDFDSFINCVADLKYNEALSPFCYIAMDVYTWSPIKHETLNDSIWDFCKQDKRDYVKEPIKGRTHFRSGPENCRKDESCKNWSTLVHDVLFICCYEEEQCMRLIIPSVVEYKKVLTVDKRLSEKQFKEQIEQVRKRYAIYYATIWRTFLELAKPLIHVTTAAREQCNTEECLQSLQKTSSCLMPDGRKATREGSEGCFMELKSSSAARISGGLITYNALQNHMEDSFSRECSPSLEHMTKREAYLGDGECSVSIKLTDYYVHCCCYAKRHLCGYTDDNTKLTTIAKQNFDEWQTSLTKRLNSAQPWTFRSFVYSDRPNKALKHSMVNQALWHCVQGAVQGDFEKWRPRKTRYRDRFETRSKNCIQVATFKFENSSSDLAERYEVTFAADDAKCDDICNERCSLRSKKCLRGNPTSGKLDITCCCTGADLCNQQDKIVKTVLCSSVYFEFEKKVRPHECSWYYDFRTKKEFIAIPMMNAYIPREGVRNPNEELCRDLVYIPLQAHECNSIGMARMVGRCWCPVGQKTCKKFDEFPMDKVRSRLCFEGSLNPTSSFVENDLDERVRLGTNSSGDRLTNSSGDGLVVKQCRSRPMCYLIMQMFGPGEFSYHFGKLEGYFYEGIVRSVGLHIKRYQITEMASVDGREDRRKFQTLIHTCFAGVNKPACNGEAKSISLMRKTFNRAVRRTQLRKEYLCADSDETTESCKARSGCFLTKGITRPDDVEMGCVERIPEVLKRKPYLRVLSMCNRDLLLFMGTTKKCFGIAALDALVCCCIGEDCVQAFRNASASYGFNPPWYNIRI